MDKRKAKERKSHAPLEKYQLEQLARLAISQTERNIRHGVDRTERITAPSGAVILSKRIIRPDSPAIGHEGRP